MNLDCNNIIDSQWCIGGEFYAEERTFVRNTLVLPVLDIAIEADRDIEGWSLNAYFKDPNFVKGDTAIVSTAIVKDSKVSFELGGDLFATVGRWGVEISLDGLGEEKGASTNSIYYNVIDNIETDGTDFVISDETKENVETIIEKLVTEVEIANEVDSRLTDTISEANESDSVLKETNIEAVSNNEVLNTTIDTGALLNGNLVESISTGNLVNTTLINNTNIAVEKNIILETNISDSIEKNNTLESTIILGTEKIQEIIYTGENQKDIVLATGDEQNNLVLATGLSEVDKVKTEGTAQINSIINQGTLEVDSVKNEGVIQKDELQTANDGYIREVEEDQEAIINLTQLMMEGITEDSLTQKTLIDNQASRLLDLIDDVIDEAMETLNKIGG